MRPRNLLPVLGLLALTSPLLVTGCEDPFEPIVWGNFPDTATLYSLARPEYVDRPGAYDLLTRGGEPRVVESLLLPAFTFDFAVTEDEQGNFVLLPTAYFPGSDARSGILADSSASFDELRRAPADGYIVEDPVPADTNVVYVLRSRRSPTQCQVYAKMEILSMGPDGVMEIRTLINPNCSDRSLVPTAPVEEDDDDAGGG